MTHLLLIGACIGWTWMLSAIAVECTREIQRAIRGWRVRQELRAANEEEDPLSEWL